MARRRRSSQAWRRRFTKLGRNVRTSIRETILRWCEAAGVPLYFSSLSSKSIVKTPGGTPMIPSDTLNEMKFEGRDLAKRTAAYILSQDTDGGAMSARGIKLVEERLLFDRPKLRVEDELLPMLQPRYVPIVRKAMDAYVARLRGDAELSSAIIKEGDLVRGKMWGKLRKVNNLVAAGYVVREPGTELGCKDTSDFCDEARGYAHRYGKSATGRSEFTKYFERALEFFPKAIFVNDEMRPRGIVEGLAERFNGAGRICVDVWAAGADQVKVANQGVSQFVDSAGKGAGSRSREISYGLRKGVRLTVTISPKG